jgi:hypothetical protein
LQLGIIQAWSIGPLIDLHQLCPPRRGIVRSLPGLSRDSMSKGLDALRRLHGVVAESKPPTVDSIRTHLLALAAAGMLISENAGLDVCRPRPGEVPPTIALVGVVTRGRTDIEKRLRSYIENNKRFERNNLISKNLPVLICGENSAV